MLKNTLSVGNEIDQQVALQERNIQLAEKTERLPQVRYKNGMIALKNLIDSQHTTRKLVQVKQTQYNA